MFISIFSSDSDPDENKKEDSNIEDINSNKEDNKDNQNETETNNKERDDKDLKNKNPLLNLELKEGNVYNGIKTKVIGTYGYFEADKSILECKEKDWIEFQQKYNDLSQYNWIEIDFDDNTAIYFSKDLSLGEYYVKDENGDFKESLNNMITIISDNDKPYVIYSVMEGEPVYFTNMEQIEYYDIDGNIIDENQPSAEDFKLQMKNAKYYDAIVKEDLETLYNAYKDKYEEFDKIEKVKKEDVNLIMTNVMNHIDLSGKLLITDFVDDNIYKIEMILFTKSTDDIDLNISNFNKDDISKLKETYFIKEIQDYSNKLAALTKIDNEITFMVGPKTVETITNRK